ncbi:MAG: Hsp20/alpha crystallin family protein [Desulfovibrionaceae bacterium]|nr:Hsp20/alpha crystallin family protein [Desulfovibrionaceae bacterium]MDD4951614.1 Hsp20/alpha crystallin family protein [Desulfovibrionaceae bacterium]
MLEKFYPALKRRPGGLARGGGLFELMDEMMRSGLGESPFFPEGIFPAVDVNETDKEVVVAFELPGIDPKDVELSLENNMLVIQGEKKRESEEKKDNYHRLERSYGSFCRSIPLPAKCLEDKVKAEYKKGVLTVRLAKDQKAAGKRIEIKS